MWHRIHCCRLDEETASIMANLDAFLVPTTVTYAALQREGVAAGMPAELVEKVGEAVKQVSNVYEKVDVASIRPCSWLMCACVAKWSRFNFSLSETHNIQSAMLLS